MSGHAAQVLEQQAAPPAVTILQKPFSGRQLAERLQELLGVESEPARPTGTEAD